MIITQTPLRISFLGGGTDFREFYSEEGGCVVSSAIDKYIFVIIKSRFDQRIRVGYTRTELVDHVDQLEHELIRECLRKTGITAGVEITTMGDIPSTGSGLGSSSTVTIGLLNAMYAYLHSPKDAATLAREACEIEIDVLGKPIGVQDQYIAAYGGQRFIRFGQDGTIEVEALGLGEDQRRALSGNLMLFYTRLARRAESVLAEQVRNIQDRVDVLCHLKRLALEGRDYLREGALDDFGLLLQKGWELKRQLASRVSNGMIDEIYSIARKNGALGGKITGAGGGGFLLLYCPRHRQDDVRAALHGLPELTFQLEPGGTRIIFDYRR